MSSKRTSRSPLQATLLDVLIDGFEKNEIMDGFHDRVLPLPTELDAQTKFVELANEATLWMGAPTSATDTGRRRLVVWSNLELRQAGRGILIRARAPWFSDWWHLDETWNGEPLGELYEWLAEE